MDGVARHKKTKSKSGILLSLQSNKAFAFCKAIFECRHVTEE